MAKVVLLATGGTIAGKSRKGVESAYASGQLQVADILAHVKGLEKLADIRCEQIANVGSQDMTIALMMRLGRRIENLLQNNDVDGIVVTHGTDTMEETAQFLNLTVKTSKPVVMTGAMRPANALSADGPLNLYNSVAVAADPKACGHGVLVVMNDRIHGAHSLTKTNTTSVEAFLSPLNGPIGIVTYGVTRYFRKPSRRHTYLSEFSLQGEAVLPRVDIFYACADMPPDLLGCSVEMGAEGIVIAGDGNGNMNRASLEQARSLAEKGIVIVRSSRVPSGIVSRNVEVDDDACGFIAADEHNPAKARILLMLALFKKWPLEKIQQCFYEY